MQTRQASLTAEVIAAARAIESSRAENVRLLYDPFARCFLSKPPIRSLVWFAGLLGTHDAINSVADRVLGPPGLMMSFCCRTRCIDDALSAALTAGYGQVLILGAGYDSRAYRIRGIEKTKVFEVDHPATQEVKRMRLQRVLADVPSHVVFVPVDFEREDLGNRLKAAGFEACTLTFVIWEGVTQYIPAEAVDSTLNFVATTCSPRSKIAFTYIHRGVLDGSEHFRGASKLTAGARRLGEPWLFGLRPEDLFPFLSTRGLVLLEDLGAHDQRDRYLVPRGRMGLLPEFTHVVVAQVP
jgi:methyltransferase (TIGR00027 family)